MLMNLFKFKGGVKPPTNKTQSLGLPIAIAGGVLLLMFGIGSTVMLTRRMNGHGMPDDE